MADPDFDKEVGKVGHKVSVVRYINSCFQEADDAKRSRMARNRENRDVYLGRQAFGDKMTGQSQEFLPKVPVSVEQMCYFIKQGLVQFGEWFSVDVSDTITHAVSGHEISELLKAFLNNLYDGNNATINFETQLGDGVKVALLESLLILKVHGAMMPVRRFFVEPGDIELVDATPRKGKHLNIQEDEEWRLRVDLVRPEDYYPDPTRNRLYEIHAIERDLHEVLQMAEDGVYDKAAVDELIDTDFKAPEDQSRQPEAMDQNETVNPGFRKRVYLKEFWGTILDDSGRIAERNVVATVANDKYLIRPPEPNPFWHQQSPFVAEPLVRVPFSVWHKALYDDASSLNLAINEMFNLMLDGGIASVWGIKQVRLDHLDDPNQVAGGIAQGATLAVKDTLPIGAQVVEDVSTGQVPQDAMAMFQFLNQEFAQAALTNEIKMGMIPKKEVRSTEVIEAGQSQAVTLDGVVGDLERNIIDKVLEKSWLTILQNADRFPEEVMMDRIDRRTALLLMRATPAERFKLFAGMTRFRAFGLSATMARFREFQKFMAALQMAMQNPLMMQAFMKRFSADRSLDTLFRLINFNPAQLMKTKDELTPEAQAMEAMRTAAASQLTGGQQGGTPTGGASVPAESNQMQAPMSGMPANA